MARALRPALSLRLERIMANTLVKSFDNFAAAEKARDALLAGGFSSSSVQLSAREDEAGPAMGNFTVGNASGRERYEDDYSRTIQRGNYLLIVDADDDDQADRASDITGRFGAIDVDARIAHRRPAA